MVGSISVRPQMVGQLSNDIANDSKGISQELDTLDSQVRSLIDQWDGAAQEAYYRAQIEWNKKIQEMNQILAQISTTTQQIADQYVESDNRSAARF
ncbi:protein-PII uridylyltransferase [Bifidobacterium anseris]|uniref:ESAT-6-like protein n=1 Tax=Bifidobacterium anseris TaxID=2020963 RepID=A0A2N5IZI9_9BIFI|nr:MULTISPECIES: WXG100 family type VII secretion target [Bifidobacterium]PLS27372.1 protein-PII uridylyltransferase [Bifidobacterium anseris]